jgi:hypothetical protein
MIMDSEEVRVLSEIANELRNINGTLTAIKKQLCAIDASIVTTAK